MGGPRIAIVRYEGMTALDAVGPMEVLRSGVSSGVDVPLVPAERLSDATTAQAIRLVTEYDPQPPHDTGSLEKASPDVVRRAVELGRPWGAIPESWEPPA